jgi:hypothetical protein
MSNVHLDHSIVGYFLTLKPEAPVQEFEKFLSTQVADKGMATYRLSKALNEDRVYLWTAQIDNAGGVDRAGRPLVLDGVLGVISKVRQTFPVEITQAFWCPVRTPEALIGEFNKLPGILVSFAAGV